MLFTRIAPAFAVAMVFAGQAVATGAQLPGVAGERSWTLEATGGFGVVTAVERCSNMLFVADTHQQIRRFDMAADRLLGDFGKGRAALATALAVDCQRRRLFVITGIPLSRNAAAAVQVFDLDSEDLLREYPLPAKFLPRPGGRFEPPTSVIVSGLWVPPGRAPSDLIQVPAAQYYDGLRLGVKLSLETGNVEPLLVPYETKCIGAGQCPDVRIDAAMLPQGPVRVAALPTSTAIGIYDARTSMPRLVDVRSPRYVRNGVNLEPGDHVDARMKWLGENSTLSHLFAFAEGVVAVHARPEIGPGYHVGQSTPFRTYMNVYGWDGKSRARDVSLPELAVGRDDDHVYAIDYGAEGRRDGAQKIRLVQIGFWGK